MSETNLQTTVQTSGEMLRHWLGHLALTRRTIEAFPEDGLLNHAAPGMRPFFDMALELLAFGLGMPRGVATGEWPKYGLPDIERSKEALLAAWDEAVAGLEDTWGSITAERFDATEKAFGVFEDRGINNLRYAIDNEIHHRAQAYVYLRELGVEPPPFWQR